MKKRGCLIALLAALMVCLLLGWLIFGGTWSWRMADYAAWRAERTQSVMPDEQALEAAQQVLVQRYYGHFWGETAWTVIARYDEQTYARVREQIEAQVPFVTEPLRWKGKNAAPIRPYFELDSFSVRLVSDAEPDIPKDMRFIGFSDATLEVLYVDYHDVDLDMVPGAFEEQLPDMIRWNTVRWPERFALLKRIGGHAGSWNVF